MLNCSIKIGNYLKMLQDIPSQSIGLVVVDFPQAHIRPNTGTPEMEEMDAKYDLSEFWSEIRRVLLPHAVCLCFSGNNVNSMHIKNSNLSEYRYDLVIDKTYPDALDTPFVGRNYPTHLHELISVFSSLAPRMYVQPAHNPFNHGPKHDHPHYEDHPHTHCHGAWTHDWAEPHCEIHHFNFPQDLLRYPMSHASHFHHRSPGNYPLDLFEELIRRYTVPNETILGLFMGDQGLGVSAINMGRNYLALEDNVHLFVRGRNILDRHCNANYFFDWSDEREDQTLLPDEDEMDGGF